MNPSNATTPTPAPTRRSRSPHRYTLVCDEPHKRRGHPTVRANRVTPSFLWGDIYENGPFYRAGPSGDGSTVA